MPTNVIGSSFSSHDNGKKNDTSLFVQIPYSRTDYSESIINENRKIPNQFRITKLLSPMENTDAV